jgi:hypothetical protein
MPIAPLFSVGIEAVAGLLPAEIAQYCLRFVTRYSVLKKKRVSL